MKKLFILLCTVAALASCGSLLTNAGPKYTFTVNDPYNDGLLTINVPSLEMVNRMTTGNQVVGVDIQISNTSTKSFTVKWGDSSIDYNREPHVVFLSGRFVSDAGKRMPDSIIHAGARVTFGVIPANNVPTAAQYQQANTNIDPINSKDISCGISVDMGGESRFYTVRVVIE